MRIRDNGSMRGFLIAIVAAAALLAVPASDYTSAKSKIESIEHYIRGDHHRNDPEPEYRHGYFTSA